MSRTFLSLVVEEQEAQAGRPPRRKREPPPLRFRFFSVEELLTLKPPPALIEGLMSQRNFVVLFAPPETAKTFIALDIALSVASGSRCFGRSVATGPVGYVAAEGQEGLKVRFQAWKVRHPAARVDRLHVLPDAINLMDVEMVNELIDQIEETWPHPPILMVFDTLARCMLGGDENSAKDVGLAVAGLDTIRKRLDCTVMVLHHTTKKGAIERGSGALRGAADTMMLVTEENDGEYAIRCEKQKNARRFGTLRFRLDTVDLGEIDDSCVVEPVAPKLSTNRRMVLQLIAGARGGLTHAEIVEQARASKTQIPATTTKRIVKWLVEEHFVERPNEARGGVYEATEAGKGLVAR